MAPRKSSRGGSDDDEPRAYLAKPIAEVAAMLDDQIAKGRQLLGQIDIHVFPQADHLQDVSARYRSWHKYNATYLERAFTTRELHDNFEGVVFGYIGGPDSDLDRLREVARDLQRDIDHLAALRERLSLYQPDQPAAPSAPARPSAVPRASPINVTFHGQVGQVNLADLIQRVDASIEQVDQRGEGGLAKALKELTDAIKAAGEAAADQRDDALDAVAVLAEVGAQPVAERAKLRGRVRGAISVIANLAEIAPVVKATWEAVGPSIMEHLPRLNS